MQMEKIHTYETAFIGGYRGIECESKDILERRGKTVMV
jgi:hypothetical protein